MSKKLLWAAIAVLALLVVGRKSWVRFANTSNVVEVLYVDYLKMQAESEIP